MDITKFANITNTSELLSLVQKLVLLDEGYSVLFVPYSPAVLSELLEIVPDKKAGKKKFTQARLAECATNLAKERGYEKRHYISQKTVSSYCRGDSWPDAVGLELMGEPLGVFFAPGLQKQVDVKQVLEYIKKLHQE